MRAPNTPTKLVSAAALIFNSAGQLLIVKAHYRRDWLLPGGVVEPNEAPLHGAVREIEEELGLVIKNMPLVAVDFCHERPGDFFKTDKINFLFDGGALTDQQIGTIVKQRSEIADYRFVELDEAYSLLMKSAARRVKTVIEAGISKKIVHYLHNGELVY